MQVYKYCDDCAFDVITRGNSSWCCDCSELYIDKYEGFDCFRKHYLKNDIYFIMDKLFEMLPECRKYMELAIKNHNKKLRDKLGNLESVLNETDKLSLADRKKVRKYIKNAIL